MSLTLAQSITQVRSTLNEASPVFWSDAEITSWIQEGCRTFSSKTLLVTDKQDIQTANLTAAQMIYTSSDETWISNVLEIYTAIYYDGTSAYKGLIKVHPRQMGNLATKTSGPPKYYAQFNDQIYIWPVPDAAVAAAGTISFLFSKNTEDITAISDEFQHLPIMYAKGMAKQKDRMFGESIALITQFYQELQFERADKYEEDVDNLDQFKVPKGGQRGQS